MRRPAPVGLFVLVLLLALGCGASAREQALRAALISTNVARDGFVAVDAARQAQIVDRAETLQAGREALLTYRIERAEVTRLFAATYELIAALALADGDATAGLTQLRTFAVELRKTLKALYPEFP